MARLNLSERLEQAKDFSEIFEVVKIATKNSLGKSRAGLMLYLQDLPTYIGAYHAFGTNAIVLNRRALNLVIRSSKLQVEVNAYVFYVLLHEYLHSLGYLEEATVRRLSHRVTAENLGFDHFATKVAEKGITAFFPEVVMGHEGPPTEFNDEVELVSEFDRSAQSYIV